MSAISPVPPARCLCGGVTITFSPDAQPLVANCFCTHCSIAAGGPSQLVLLFDEPAITVSDPENLIVMYDISGTESGIGKPKYFCGRCGCTLFTKPGSYSGKAFVRSSLVEGGCALFKPHIEIFTKNRPAFMNAAEGAAQFEGRFEEKA